MENNVNIRPLSFPDNLDAYKPLAQSQHNLKQKQHERRNNIIMDISNNICICGSHLKQCIVMSDIVKKTVRLCSATLEQGVQWLWGASQSWLLHSIMHAAHAI